MVHYAVIIFFLSLYVYYISILYIAARKKRFNAILNQGDGKLSTGKDPLSIEVYEKLNKLWLSYSRDGFGFGQCFLTLTWNLICRVNNTMNIRTNHIAWEGDCLAIYFGKQKNDQAGDKPRDPKHIYANIYQPWICPILSLAIYLCVQKRTSADHSALFEGTSQDGRFRNLLSRCSVGKAASTLHFNQSVLDNFDCNQIICGETIGNLYRVDILLCQ